MPIQQRPKTVSGAPVQKQVLGKRVIVWLASYPRSGNTYLRLLLREVFGAESYSVYPGEAQVFQTSIQNMIGHREPANVSHLIGSARASHHPVFIKTHDAPAGADAAIYIVRHGGAALVSYRHYLIHAGSEVELPQLIKGEIWPGSWSEHIASWAPWQRSQTLILKYEDCVAVPEETCSRIGKFLGLSPSGRLNTAFETLQSLNPFFFRSGNNSANIEELRPYEDLFELHHGEMMRRLGYQT